MGLRAWFHSMVHRGVAPKTTWMPLSGPQAVDPPTTSATESPATPVYRPDRMVVETLAVPEAGVTDSATLTIETTGSSPIDEDSQGAETRRQSSATWERYRSDPSTASFRFVVPAGVRACKGCRGRNGVVVDREDQWWFFNLPPLHDGCTCTVEPVAVEQHARRTSRKRLDSIEYLPLRGDDEGTGPIPKGFGGYDPGAELPPPSSGR